ncbi:MAG: hypothetical protein EXS63_06760 [Candidatus Omnitrophica bacterium]|nr:hypothetical protein [Candidatus Omnitrophota bacterium]
MFQATSRIRKIISAAAAFLFILDSSHFVVLAETLNPLLSQTPQANVPAAAGTKSQTEALLPAGPSQDSTSFLRPDVLEATQSSGSSGNISQKSIAPGSKTQTNASGTIFTTRSISNNTKPPLDMSLLATPAPARAVRGPVPTVVQESRLDLGTDWDPEMAINLKSTGSYYITYNYKAYPKNAAGFVEIPVYENNKLIDTMRLQASFLANGDIESLKISNASQSEKLTFVKQGDVWKVRTVTDYFMKAQTYGGITYQAGDIASTSTYDDVQRSIAGSFVSAQDGKKHTSVTILDSQKNLFPNRLAPAELVRFTNNSTRVFMEYDESGVLFAANLFGNDRIENGKTVTPIYTLFSIGDSDLKEVNWKNLSDRSFSVVSNLLKDDLMIDVTTGSGVKDIPVSVPGAGAVIQAKAMDVRADSIFLRFDYPDGSFRALWVYRENGKVFVRVPSPASNSPEKIYQLSVNGKRLFAFQLIPTPAISNVQLTVSFNAATLSFDVDQLQPGQTVEAYYRRQGVSVWTAAAMTTVPNSATRRTIQLNGLFESTAYEYNFRVVEGTGLKAEQNGNFKTAELAPVISAIKDQSFSEDGSVTIAIDTNDGTPGSTPLTISATSNNSQLLPVGSLILEGTGPRRSLTLRPLANANGSAQITVSATDSVSTISQTFLVTVASVNDAPIIAAISDVTSRTGVSIGVISLTVGDIETDASVLSLSAVSSNTSLIDSAGITFGGSGASRTMVLTPKANQSGSAPITVNVSDGVNTASRTFTLTVNSVNDKPTISVINPVTIDEDGAPSGISLTIGDTETNANLLSLSAVSSNTSLIDSTGITFGGSGASRTITLKPKADQSGSAQITVSVSDGVNISDRTFALTVNPINDAPTISTISDVTIRAGVSGGAISLTVADLETFAGSLAVTGSSSNSAVVDQAGIVFGGSGANRTLTITPKGKAGDTAVITVMVSDGVLSTIRKFNVTVDSVISAAEKVFWSNTGAKIDALITPQIQGLDTNSASSLGLAKTALTNVKTQILSDRSSAASLGYSQSEIRLKSYADALDFVIADLTMIISWALSPTAIFSVSNVQMNQLLAAFQAQKTVFQDQYKSLISDTVFLDDDTSFLDLLNDEEGNRKVMVISVEYVHLKEPINVNWLLDPISSSSLGTRLDTFKAAFLKLKTKALTTFGLPQASFDSLQIDYDKAVNDTQSSINTLKFLGR